MKRNLQTILLVLLSGLASSFAGEIHPPKDALGFEIGADYKLANFEQITDYFYLLAHESDRIKILKLGRTHEGNMLFAALISSPQNLQNIEKLKGVQKQLADPRLINDELADSLFAIGKTIICINCSIHAHEVGSAQMSLVLGYELATSNSADVLNILEQTIVILIPVHNPDGLNSVSGWYQRYLGTKYEGCRLPQLYQKYTGHDINRDWYMLTQPETRLTVEKIYNQWRPHIVLDMHQFGKYAPRLFLPPYCEPIDPNIDPILVNEMNALGQTVVMDLVASGYTGIITSTFFDAWSPSRAYVNYHGGVRVLSEVASCLIASPVYVNLKPKNKNKHQDLKQSVNYPVPWIEGNWRLTDIVNYNKAVTMSVLSYAARFSDMWKKNFYLVGKRAIHKKFGPTAYIIPQNQRNKSTLFELLEILQNGLVEIHQAEESFTVDGCSFIEGSYVIFLNQPYRAYAKTLLEKQQYPEHAQDRAYDISGHSLPPLMGIEFFSTTERIKIRMRKLTKIDRRAIASSDEVETAEYVSFSLMSNDAYKAVNFLFSSDCKLFLDQLTTTQIVIKNDISDDLREKLMNDYSIEIEPFANTMKLFLLKRPRVGLYKSNVPSIDEGWTRYVLEEYNFDYTSTEDAEIKRSGLHQRYDVILLPRLSGNELENGYNVSEMPAEFCGGMGPEGRNNLIAFVKNGGTLISIDQSIEFVISCFDLPVEIEDIQKKADIWIPGPILNLEVNPLHPIAFGSAKRVAFIAYRMPLIKTTHQTGVAQYADQNMLVSGALRGGELLSGRPLILDFKFGKGRVYLYAFRPFFRAQTRAAYRLVFNALLFDKYINFKNDTLNK